MDLPEKKLKLNMFPPGEGPGSSAHFSSGAIFGAGCSTAEVPMDCGPGGYHSHGRQLVPRHQRHRIPGGGVERPRRALGFTVFGLMVVFVSLKQTDQLFEPGKED